MNYPFQALLHWHPTPESLFSYREAFTLSAMIKLDNVLFQSKLQLTKVHVENPSETSVMSNKPDKTSFYVVIFKTNGEIMFWTGNLLIVSE